MASPFLEVHGITKRFPGVLALDAVSLRVSQGEILGLIGENGAGKSTLMNILGGIYQPDAGAILIDGQPVSIADVAQSHALGLGFIHQELNVLGNLDVAANIFLGREPLRSQWWGVGLLKLIDRKKLRRDAQPYMRKLGLDISPSAPMRNLSLAQQQMVEIAKALSQRARLLIMDEPTSSLTLSETRRLLETIQDLKRQGVGIIYISHRLAEVQTCADRIEVLRDGRNAGALARDQISHDRMIRLMVGRDLKSMYLPGAAAPSSAGLEICALVTPGNRRRRISFTAHRGEILGIAGLVGAGRSEMAQTLFGINPPLSGKILLDGHELKIASPQDAVAAGIFLVPEDRRQAGLLVDLNIHQNITLPGLKNYTRVGLIRRNHERAFARQQADALQIRAANLEAKAGNLSGGNQQKVVLAKWLALEPQVLIVDEPTRGIDVGAKAEVYRILRVLADRDVAVIMISSDMEEVLGVSDRIAVMHEGAISGFLSRAEFSEESIMRLAIGKPAA
jgi:ribose transport system ATP-binding protein